VCSLIGSWGLQSTAASLQSLKELPPETSGGDRKADVQDWGIGGGGCDVGEEGGQAEERGMDNEKCYQFFMSIWKLYSRSESPNTILYL